MLVCIGLTEGFVREVVVVYMSDSARNRDGRITYDEHCRQSTVQAFVWV